MNGFMNEVFNNYNTKSIYSNVDKHSSIGCAHENVNDVNKIREISKDYPSATNMNKLCKKIIDN